MLEEGTFTFLVGPKEQRFDIHSAVVARHSSELANMMNNGKMEESLMKLIKFPEVEPNTFACFVEYAYTGTYRLRPKAFSSTTDVERKVITRKNLFFQLEAKGVQTYFCRCGSSTNLEQNQAIFPRCSATCSSTSSYCLFSCHTVIQPDLICDPCAKSRNTNATRLLTGFEEKLHDMEYEIGRAHV